MNGDIMVKKQEKSKHTLKTYLFTGVLVTAPIALTFYLAWQVASYIDTKVIGLIPAKYSPDTYFPFGLPGLGILLLLAFLILVGMLTASYVGRLSSNLWTHFITKMPVLSGVYNAFRKIFETVLGAGKETAFRQAVLVEYPRRDIWTVAFVTGPVYKGVQRLIKDDLISIYVPTTPNPTSGFLLYVPKKDIIPLNIGVDEAFKMVISTGIVNPQDKSALKKGKKA